MDIGSLNDINRIEAVLWYRGQSSVYELRFVYMNRAGLLLIVERATVASMAMDTILQAPHEHVFNI